MIWNRPKVRGIDPPKKCLVVLPLYIIYAIVEEVDLLSIELGRIITFSMMQLNMKHVLCMQ